MTGRGILVIGLGNELVSDDGFGPAVAAACRDALAGREDVVVESAAVAGFHLLDLMSGHGRVLIVDVVRTGMHAPGTLHRWPLSRASSARTLGGSHEADIETALALGAALGYEVPEEITLLVAEALDLETVRMEMTPAVAAAVRRAAALAATWVEFGTLSLPETEA